MTKTKINFKLKDVNENEKTIDINLKIINIPNIKEIKLYKGNIKLLNIETLEHITETNSEIILNPTSDNIEINYKVQIANLGKHGQNGEINSELITFTGSQILLLPTNILRGSDLELAKAIEEINIDYTKKLNNKELIVPFKQDIESNVISNVKTPKWHDIYELMKSCYAFVEFENIEKYEYKSTNILIQKNKTIKEKQHNIPDVVDEINSLCNYYEKLFDYKIKNLKIILLDKNKKNGEYILGGAGRSIIGATFDPNNLRDWQLLSHRLFHAYMDSAIRIRQMHIAPQLWITEGLATYHENLALQSLTGNLKDKLEIDFDKEIKKIYRRYLYIRIKDKNRLSIAPIEEGKIHSHGKMEFLHYTQAPLIIKMIEDFSSTINEKNRIIEYLKRVNENTFNLKSMFDYSLKHYCDEFAYKYIFNSNIISLWDLGECNIDERVVLKELNEYEELLWSWFAMEDNLYSKEIIKYQDNDKLVKMANMLNLRFEDITIEKEIKKFCSTIYNLLKVHLLRARVCSVNLSDINLRYRLYEDKNNIKLWNEYLN